MINTMKKGFTLIELLVVITIIWILATGWVSIFTKQLQWARDATRISDVELLQTSINLYHSDEEVYPDPASFSGAVKWYMTKQVEDPKVGKPVCWRDWAAATDPNRNDQNCGWVYARTSDEYWLEDAAYKFGIYFEKETNLKNIAESTWKDTDGWINNSMYEVFAWAWAVGIDIQTTVDATAITVTWLNSGVTTSTTAY